MSLTLVLQIQVPDYVLAAELEALAGTLTAPEVKTASSTQVTVQCALPDATAHLLFHSPIPLSHSLCFCRMHCVAASARCSGAQCVAVLQHALKSLRDCAQLCEV